MESTTTSKPRRGRPRTDAPPRSDIHARLPPALKAQLEREAKRAHRSVAKEFELRIQTSYVSDGKYGGPQMASMFREMAEAASGIEKQKNRGSFFEDFATFVFVRDVWQIIIQRRMPRPSEELLVQVCREWDALKSGSPQTAAQQATREWLVHHTPITLAQSLARMFEPAVNGSAGARGSRSDQAAETTEATATREPNMPPRPLVSRGKIPAVDSLAEAMHRLLPSDLSSGSFASSVAVSPLDGIAQVMVALVPSQGSTRAAAREISRLALVLAEMTEGGAASDNAVPPVGPDTGTVVAHGNSPE